MQKQYCLWRSFMSLKIVGLFFLSPWQVHKVLQYVCECSLCDVQYCFYNVRIFQEIDICHAGTIVFLLIHMQSCKSVQYMQQYTLRLSSVLWLGHFYKNLVIFVYHVKISCIRLIGGILKDLDFGTVCFLCDLYLLFLLCNKVNRKPFILNTFLSFTQDQETFQIDLPNFSSVVWQANFI